MDPPRSSRDRISTTTAEPTPTWTIHDNGDTTSSLNQVAGADIPPIDDPKALGADAAEPRGEVQPRWKRWSEAILTYLVDQWFLIGIGLVIVLAWRFPEVAKEDGIIKSQYSIHYGALAAIFLITGLTLSTKALIQQALNIRLHLFTQIFSFLFFPTVVFAIVNIIKAAQGGISSMNPGGPLGREGGGSIEGYVLVGMIVLSVLPTTVASNITMTRNAKGSVESATSQVCLGNLLGAFISPPLLLVFLRSSWAFGQPIATGGREGVSGLGVIYGMIGKQLGLCLFLPLIVGQVVQNIFPTQTKWIANTFQLAKLSSLLLLTMIWTTFSTQFANNAFSQISTSSIILILFLNLALYSIFTVLCVFGTRLPGLGLDDAEARLRKGRGEELSVWKRLAVGYRFDKGEATAVAFCAAAKGIVVGAPVLDIMYGGFDARSRAILTIPLVLYQGEQVVIAQIIVPLFRKWNEGGDPKRDPKPTKSDEGRERVSESGSGDVEDDARTLGLLERGKSKDEVV